jgi:hypothetical protein
MTKLCECGRPMQRASRLRDSARPWLALALFALAAVAPACTSAAGVAAPTEVRAQPYHLVEGWRTILAPPQRWAYKVTWNVLRIGDVAFESRVADAGADATWVVRCATSPTEWAAALARFGGHATTWIDAHTLLPRGYVWNAGDQDAGKRRINEFHAGESWASGIEITPQGWESKEYPTTIAHDPVSLLVLLRVLELADGERLQVELIEGPKKRVATIVANGDEEVEIKKGLRVRARRFGFRVDMLRDDQLAGADPDSDLDVWVSLDERRWIVRSEGEIQGRGVTLTLVDPPLDSHASVAAPPAR